MEYPPWYFTRIKTTIVVLMRVKYQGGYSILALGGHYSWYFTRIKTTTTVFRQFKFETAAAFRGAARSQDTGPSGSASGLGLNSHPALLGRPHSTVRPSRDCVPSSKDAFAPSLIPHCTRSFARGWLRLPPSSGAPGQAGYTAVVAHLEVGVRPICAFPQSLDTQRRRRAGTMSHVT